METRIYTATIVTTIKFFGKKIELVWENQNYENEKKPNKKGKFLELNIK